jgi:hypothetical protein
VATLQGAMLMGKVQRSSVAVDTAIRAALDHLDHLRTARKAGVRPPRPRSKKKKQKEGKAQRR